MSRATEEQVAWIVDLLSAMESSVGKNLSRQFNRAEKAKEAALIAALRAMLDERTELLEDRFTLRLASEYGDDLGFVLWWHLPVCEPPEVDNGEALQMTDNAGVQWYTHFSLLPTNAQIDAAVPKSEEKPK